MPIRRWLCYCPEGRGVGLGAPRGGLGLGEGSLLSGKRLIASLLSPQVEHPRAPDPFPGPTLKGICRGSKEVCIFQRLKGDQANRDFRGGG